MGFAALWILFFHEWQILSTPGSLWHEIEYFVKRIGFCGVDIFFLLSGMGMVYSSDCFLLFACSIVFSFL